MPSSCRGAPTGKECIDAVVYYLDKARSRVHLPPYALPANFPSLSPPRQLFILVNLDRVQYGLRPIPGMTAALDHDALVSGVWRADDPHPSNTTGLNTWWPGWAGAFYNAPMAYEAWVWDDGLGSKNPRCTPTDHSRCWGHRHSVLWKYGPVLAMGAAAGRDSRHPPRLRVSLRRRQRGLQAGVHVHLEAGRRGRSGHEHVRSRPSAELAVQRPGPHRAEAGRRVTGDREGALQRRRGRPQAHPLRARNRDPAVPRVGHDARAWREYSAHRQPRPALDHAFPVSVRPTSTIDSAPVARSPHRGSSARSLTFRAARVTAGLSAMAIPSAIVD